MSKTKMICSHCGAEMNHHADKVERLADDLKLNDEIFGGTLQEIHTCPACGNVDSREAT